MREVRMALLEADVALPVVKDFVAKVRRRRWAGGHRLADARPGPGRRGATTSQGADGRRPRGLDLSTQPPAVVLMAGLQGAGKTTTTGKLAKLLHEQQRRRCWWFPPTSTARRRSSS